MKRNFMPTACLALWAFIQGSCSDDFAPYSRLEGLRVLAIQSEPVAPAAGQTTTLTPLVFAKPGETISYAWSWCPLAGPASKNAPCLITETELATLVAQIVGPDVTVNIPPYDLGNQPTASFTNPFPAEALRALCENKASAGPNGGSPKASGAANSDGGAPANQPAGTAANPFLFNCTNGFPISIKMVATTPSDTVTTLRALDLSYDPLAPPNTNPTISNLTAQLLKRDEDRDKNIAGDQFDGPLQPLLETPDAVATRQRDMRLTVIVPLSSSEPSKDKDEQDRVIDSKERLFLSWFVESGDVDDARTGFIDGKTTLEKALKNIWRPSSVKKYPGTQSKVVAVVRDSRGGVAWTWGTAALVESPK